MKRTEDDNLGKKGSREYIASIINYYFKKENNIFMFDFLGGGVGAEFYLKKCKSIKHITLLDYKKCKYKSFLLNSFRKLQWFNLEKDIQVFNLDINDFLNDTCCYSYNIFNLDFCTYFYDNGKENCSSSIIKKVFKTGAIADDGLLLCTFQVKGMGVNFGKSKHEIIVDENLIKRKIIEIGKKEGYIVNIDDLSYRYKSSRSSEMINLCFKVKKEAK